MKTFIPLAITILFTCQTKAQNFSSDSIQVLNEIVVSHESSDILKAKLFSRDSVLLLQELKQMYTEDQQGRKSHEYFMAHSDDIRQQDSIHTQRLIEITNTYGFPSSSRFNIRKHNIHPHIIFVHAPEMFADTLTALLNTEKAAGRITHNEHAHIMWHLQGRKEIPQFEGAKTKRKKNGTVRMKFKGFD